MKKKMVMLFPGVRYSVDCPLLYYPGMKYERLGYEKLEIREYEVEGLDGLEHLKAYAEQAEKNVLRQVAGIEFSKYEEIVFVEKSIGTVIGMWLEDELGLNHVTHIALTPINETLPFLTENRKITYMVTGTEDAMVNAEQLRAICKKNGFPLSEIGGAGHRLETSGSMRENINILLQVVEAC